MESESKVPKELKIELGFVQRRLPWLVAAVAFVVYVITLNHSSTQAGISALANAAGWEWRSNLVAPLHVILTFPVRWLPTGLQLIFLNLTAAVCASLALALLARSVALLPHDRTREQRGLERSDHSLLSIGAAWLPPVLAVLICGLQLSFWENAVVATGEALALLLFAWLVHALLQYRLDEKESRLPWFAFVYGLALVNNYAMVGFFPAFLIALIWIKGASFFKWRFLLRMAGCGAAGLLLYLLLPAVESATGASDYSFWEMLRFSWGHQKNMLVRFPRFILLFISLTSLLPVLFMGIRWPAQFGEISAIGNALTNLMTHVIHAVFLAACIYVTFDLTFSPRGLSAGLPYALLPFYYLGALAIGYCSGYFLLVFGAKPGPQTWQRSSPIRRVINFVVVGLVWVAFVAVPAALLVKNLPTIHANSGEAMDRLSRATAKSLPETGAVVLSDDRFRLFSLQYELSKSNPGHKHILVDTESLAAAAYHTVMRKKHPNRWPQFASPPNPRSILNSISLIEILYVLHQTGPVYYLHPSFGYYFEFFHARPRGLVYELKLNPTNSIAAPPMTAAEVKEQDAFWRSLKAAEFDPLIKKAVAFEKLRPGKYKPKSWTLDQYLAEIYSRALNHFGVELQKADTMTLAGDYFDWAAQLNPGSPTAWHNRNFNRRWREGKREALKVDQEVLDRLVFFDGSWALSLGQNGPPDEPTACYSLAREFELGGNFRQAGQFMERTLHFDPNNRSAQIVSILLHLKAQFPEIALQRANAFRARHGAIGLTEDEEIDLLNAEAWSHVVKNELPAAERLLADAQRKYPRSSAPWDTLGDIYVQLGRVTNALETLEKQLRAQPDSQQALVKSGGILWNLGRYTEALIPLDRALSLNPNNESALLNRAMVNSRLDRLDAAQRDYDTLLKVAKSNNRVNALFGLAEIHFRKKNRKESLKYYEDFLKVAPPSVVQIPVARERVRILESGAPL